MNSVIRSSEDEDETRVKKSMRDTNKGLTMLIGEIMGKE
jgi:hypothetical protein